MHKRIEEGLASPSAGEMTKEKLDRLVDRARQGLSTRLTHGGQLLTFIIIVAT
jgi:hypothetical protein